MASADSGRAQGPHPGPALGGSRQGAQLEGLRGDGQMVPRGPRPQAPLPTLRSSLAPLQGKVEPGAWGMGACQLFPSLA